MSGDCGAHSTKLLSSRCENERSRFTQMGERGEAVQMGLDDTLEAAEAGNLEMLKYCFEGYRNEGDFGPAPGRFWTAQGLCVGAAKGGCLECLLFTKKSTSL